MNDFVQGLVVGVAITIVAFGIVADVLRRGREAWELERNEKQDPQS